MGMVVSAAVSGIPIIEQLEKAHPIPASKRTGGKRVAIKENSASGITTGSQPSKQLKGKTRGTESAATKGGAQNGNKSAAASKPKPPPVGKAKAGGVTTGPKQGAKGVSNKENTGKSSEARASKVGGKDASAPKGGAKGRDSGKR